MKVVFCWSVLSGYMAACWRALSSRPGIDLHILAHRAGGSTAFRDDLLAGLSHQFLDTHEYADCGLVEDLVATQRPDVVVMTGWWLKAYRNLLHSRRLSSAKFIMGVDSPWRIEAQFLTRFRYAASLRKVDHFFVAGERSWQYVKRLGVSPERISRGFYGIDDAQWELSHSQRVKSPWPRQFLFLGRYEPVKGLDLLVAAYRLYRQRVQNPWRLVCCGRGPDAPLVQGEDGIEDRGFVQPADLPGVFAESGAFVLPSRFDPWPLALVEAAAAGLPVVCSEACGSAVEIVRPYFNGLLAPTGSVEALARALHDIHVREADLPAWGQRSRQFAAAYAANVWADRWISVLHELCGQRQ